MLRKLRISLALIFFIGITLLFLDFSGTAHRWLGWMAKVQFLPAVMALNVGVLVALVLLTLLLGRVYCSVICPLGVWQDVVSHLSARRKGKKARFRYSPALTIMRVSVLLLFLAAALFGVSWFVALLAPYSTYGRFATAFLAPLWQLANNGLALLAEHADSYAFYPVEVRFVGVSTFALAFIAMVVVTVLAWRGGRTWCNTVCPVGTILGWLARFSLLKPVINLDKCTSCGACARGCKASCIDAKNHSIDYSRCVACMDCLGRCSTGAISYSRLKRAPEAATAHDAGRRSFLTVSSIAVGAAASRALAKTTDGGLALILDKETPTRHTPIAPPGALSLRNLQRRCTSCQLCISACPSRVLKPGSELDTLMQPVVDYSDGYCRPECNECSQVCPAGAIQPISLGDKASTQVGHAVWVRANCVPLTDGVECGNCARHCPTGAISMVASDPDNPDSVKIPVVNTAICIGCGACENLCPARPFSAIYVEGHENHKLL